MALVTRNSWFLLLAPLLISACQPGSADKSNDDTDDVVDTGGLADLVFLITVDTLNRSFMGAASPWNTTPNIDVLMDEGAYLPNVLVPRGLTTISMASFTTGLYPRTHGVRILPAFWEGQWPSLFSRFQEAGYSTFGFSNNQCTFFELSTDFNFCQHLEERAGGHSQFISDGMMVTKLLEALDERPQDQPLFVWLHFMDPHDPYTPHEPYYSEFHPEQYTGDLNTARRDMLNMVMRNEREFTEEDRTHLYAAYASQIRTTDDYIGQVLNYLRDEGLYDDSVIMFGTDHGEELAVHENYFFHDCSFYNEVIGTTWILRGPDIPPGVVNENWISALDVAPTLVELGGLEWSGELEGISRVSEIQGEEINLLPVFFERGSKTAGVISGGFKYMSNPVGEYHTCTPYVEQADGFDGDVVALYDLESDPHEMVNVVDDHPALAQELRTTLCDWVTSSTWEGEEQDRFNPLVQGCLED